MEQGNQPNMARRFRWLSGLVVVGLTLARLGRLLQPQIEGPPWQLVLASAVVLGAVFTWTAIAYRWSLFSLATLNVLGMFIALLRITAPGTLRLGMLPTVATWPVVEEELGFAWEIIRYGAAPVLPVAGLVAVLTLVYWAIGALGAVGIMRGRQWLVVLPSIVFYLQLATLDRRSPGLVWLLAFAVTAALALVSMSGGEDPSTGRLRLRTGSFLRRSSGTVPAFTAVLAVVASVYASTALAANVPESGVLQWRNQSGIGSGLFGGSSFNLFVGLQQSLVSLGDDPLFYARVSDSAPANDDLYWRLITLEVFDGENWVPSAQSFARQGSQRWERPDMRFQGPTVPVAARVRIDGLGQQLLPILYSPTRLVSTEDLIADSFRVREDGSVGIDLRTRAGWEYEFTADVPQPDVAQLASLGGELSPIFQEAADSGVFTAEPKPPVFRDRPEDIDDYLELPETVPLSVRELARSVTEDGITRFEKSLILEAWFRDPGNFTYSTEVSTGHDTLELEGWLLIPESRNYRTGYCEQFATAMAVMARSLGLPSRIVLGFTPGDIETQADGSELIVVRERNAHAWVELWMDGQGWVRFDPTPRSDGVNPSLGTTRVGFDPRIYVPAPDDSALTGDPVTGIRPEIGLDERIDVSGGDATPDLRSGPGIDIPLWMWWIIALVTGGAAIPVTKLVRRRRRLARIRTGDVTAAWEEIVDRLRDLGVGVDTSHTPIEIAKENDADLVPLATLYTAAAYGGRPRGDGRTAFARAERYLSRTFQAPHRAYAWLLPTSLRKP